MSDKVIVVRGKGLRGPTGATGETGEPLVDVDGGSPETVYLLPEEDIDGGEIV